MSSLVFIQAVTRPTATGLSEFVDPTSNKKIGKIKMGRARDFIRALYDPRVGGLANHISYTPYTDPSTGMPKKKEDGSVMMLQEYLENKWNKPKGYFTNEAVPPNKQLKPGEETYFQAARWMFEDGSTVLDMNKLEDEMFYYVCLASSKVANSETEYRQHKWPKAEYFIALENESDVIKYQKSQLKSKAYAALHSEVATEDVKRKMLALLNIMPAKSISDTSVEQVHNSLVEYIDRATTTAKNLEKYTYLMSLLGNGEGTERFNAMFLLQLAIDKRVIYEKQGTHTWVRPSGNVTIGDTYEEAVEYLISPKRHKEVEDLTKAINSK